jgi:hypothetical protein
VTCVTQRACWRAGHAAVLGCGVCTYILRMDVYICVMEVEVVVGALGCAGMSRW